MKVTILGGGPSGLYAAILIARARTDADVRVIEQNRADATFGFGVVFSDQALGFLRADDPETAALIEPRMMRWPDIVVSLRGAAVAIDGIGFSGIGRLELLRLLQGRAAALGVRLEFARRVDDPGELAGADLVIGADGLNSVVRGAAPEAFGARLSRGANRFVWYGCYRDFDALTQSFIDTRHGPATAHHYGYAPGRGTFIVELPPATFAAAGLAEMPEPEGRALCEGLFAEALGGARLISNASRWRRFPDLECARWYCGNRVLLGDALHTAHFSIGSGTRLAMEDAIALVGALQAAGWDVAAALPAYQAARAPVLAKLQGAARASAAWYEGFGGRMGLDPWRFALSYALRAGRLDGGRLAALAPRFAAGLARRGISPEGTA